MPNILMCISHPQAVLDDCPLLNILSQKLCTLHPWCILPPSPLWIGAQKGLKYRTRIKTNGKLLTFSIQPVCFLVANYSQVTCSFNEVKKNSSSLTSFQIRHDIRILICPTGANGGDATLPSFMQSYRNGHLLSGISELPDLQASHVHLREC